MTLQNGLEPNDTLEFEYCVQRVSPEQIDRLEVSVVWFTEGKGSEDIGVHYFESLSGEELLGGDRSMRVETKLPSSPLSYDGRLFAIRWCIRLRLFLRDGRDMAADQPIYVGHLSNEV